MADIEPPPGLIRVAAALEQADSRDREIVEGLPLRFCRTVDDVDLVCRYVLGELKSLAGPERNALLFGLYLQSLILDGKVTGSDDVFRDAFARRVRVESDDSDGEDNGD